MSKNIFILPNDLNPIQDKKVKYNRLLRALGKFNYDELKDDEDFVIKLDSEELKDDEGSVITKLDSEELKFKFFGYNVAKTDVIVIAESDINKYYD